jgi:peroxin-7
MSVQVTPPGHECLTFDWNKYSPLTVHTGSTDTTITTYDLRRPSPVSTLRGHRLAVKKLAASPYSGRLLASASYDMTVRVWDLETGKEGWVWGGHTEFVQGVDWSLFAEGWVGTTGWDGRVFVSEFEREWRRV